MDLGKQPYANSLLKYPLQPEKKYPLELAFCLNCSLVQLTHTADPKDLFSNYLWVTGTSPTTRRHAQTFFRRVMRHDRIKNWVIEVGSNDGTFLVPFAKCLMSVLGIDPAKNMKQLAWENECQIPTETEFFTSRIAKKYKGIADVVIARNVLPHVKDTNDFVKGLEIMMSDNSRLALEIHYAKIILEDLHYDSIYHEHLCYFSLKSLEYLLNKHNLYVEDIAKSPINAGNIIVIAKRGKVKEKKIVQKYRDKEKEIELNEYTSWVYWARRIVAHKIKLLKLLKDKQVVGYGASARSSTLLNYCGIRLPLIADANPLKQGLYTAGSHIVIRSPEEVMNLNPEYILILAWNFKDEIMQYLWTKYHYKGKFIIPLPKPYEK